MSRRKILIVDDDFSARMLLLTLLRPHGECDVAVDGEEALKAVQQAFEANRPYELICLDIMMAGMDGQTCLRHIRSIEREAGRGVGAGALVIMTSSLDDSTNVVTAFRESCDAYLVKPITREAIAQELERLGFSTPKETGEGMRVLAADDDPNTLLATRAILEKLGFQVVTAEDGQAALDILTGPNPPDVAVLDWVMPGRNGVDICRFLQASGSTPFIYRILLTGKTGREERLEGLASGAHDLLNKPVDAGELGARLTIGRRIVAYERRIAEDNRKLEQYAARLEFLAEERARQLVHADRLASLGTMAAGVAHEINNPTAMISGNAQLIGSCWPLLRAALQGEQSASEREQKQRDFLIEEMPNLISGIEQGVKRVSTIVHNLGQFARQECGKKGPCDLSVCMIQSMEMMEGVCRRNDVAVNIVKPDHLPTVQAITQEMVQVLINLIHNACQAMENSTVRQLDIVMGTDEQQVVIEVRDTGPGIPPRLLDNIWKPFFTTKPPGQGTGLGLSICQSIIAAHNGRITVGNREGGGAVFRVYIPTPREPHRED